MHKSLSNYTDEDLHKELTVRATERTRLAKEQLKIKQNLLLDNINLILKLIPEHIYKNCSDSINQNQDRCPRCRLIDIKHNNWISDEFDYEFEITNFDY